MARYDAKYYACGCWIRDTAEYGTKIVWNKCKKHRSQFKQISWLKWAKNNAPSQYKEYKKESQTLNFNTDSGKEYENRS